MNATIDQYTCDAEPLNSLLRGELAAVKTCTQALVAFDDALVIAELQKIRDEHSRAVRELRDHLVQLGCPPGESMENLTVPIARSAVPAVVLAALRTEEGAHVIAYEAALENETIHPDCKRTIQLDLLPACRKHVEELNRLLGGPGD